MTSLTRKQFDILAALAESKAPLTQRELEKAAGYSLGTVNRIVKDLSEKGLVAEGFITPAGLSALEPYRARRAVLLLPVSAAAWLPLLSTPPSL